MRKWLVLALFLCFSLSFGAKRLDCYLTTSCSDFVVYKLSNYTNAHGALYNYTSENYVLYLRKSGTIPTYIWEIARNTPPRSVVSYLN